MLRQVIGKKCSNPECELHDKVVNTDSNMCGKCSLPLEEIASVNRLTLGIPVAVLVIVALYFGVKWFSDPATTASSIPLGASQAAVQRDMDEFKGAVAKFRAEAQTGIVKLAQDAISDDFLSVEKEQTYSDRAAAEVESLKRQVPESAIRDGFVFHFPHPPDQRVAGFPFSGEEIHGILESEFGKRGTAVKERDLIERLRSMVQQFSQPDQRLDDTKRADVIRFITTPEQGKKAALSRKVAEATIDRYCREKGIRTGPRS
jgi:hypothetical protein